MTECFRGKRAQALGSAVAGVNVLAEALAIGYYMSVAHGDILKGSGGGREETEATSSPTLTPAPHAADADKEWSPGPLLAAGITAVAVISVDLMLVWGAFRRRLTLFLPWLLLHAALLVEALLVFVFCAAKSIVDRVSGEKTTLID